MAVGLLCTKRIYDSLLALQFTLTCQEKAHKLWEIKSNKNAMFQKVLWWLSVLSSGLEKNQTKCDFYSNTSIAPRLKFGITDSLWILFRLSENMLEPVEKIHALIDPAVRLPQHWGTGSVFRLPVSDTSCRKKRESEPCLQGKALQAFCGSGPDWWKAMSRFRECWQHHSRTGKH